MNDVFSLLTSFAMLKVSRIDNYQLRIEQGINRKELEHEEVKKMLQAMGFNSDVGHHESGQPYLVHHPEYCVSISHSGEWVAVIVAEHSVGIDIELDHQRIEEAIPYFLHFEERHFVENRQALQLIWSAKEAFFKMIGGELNDLQQEVVIQSIGQRVVEVCYQSKLFQLMYEQKNGVTLVVATPSN